MMTKSPKYTALHIATACFLIRSRPVTEALSVGSRHAAPSTHSRRNFLSTIVCGSAAPFLLTAPAVAADDAQSNDSILCQPPKKLLGTLSETRSQIDLAVQACSVQAFSSAAEIVNDKLLDSSSLNVLFDSCNNPSFTQQQQESGGVVISDILLQSIERMRTKLNSTSGSSLTTEDAMDVMRYGTTARSSMDSIFAL